MPVIARFYGILIKMYFREHGVPHFHALYGERNGVFEIESLEMIEGDLPDRAQEMIKEQAAMYQDDLMELYGEPKNLRNFQGWNNGENYEKLSKNKAC